MFVEAFHSTIKGIHLALEVKTSFGNSSLRQASVQNPAHRSLDFPLTTINGFTERERRAEICTQKVIKQSLSDYAQQD
jgi:hypothetical protein